MYCKWCGDIIDDDCVVCPKCGKQVSELKQITPSNNNNTEDKADGGIALLSFIFPLVGLIVYCSNISTRPNYAREAGAAAIAGFFVGIFILPLIGCGALFL